MSGDYARWLANETAAALAHDRCDKALDSASEVCPRCFRQHTWLMEDRPVAPAPPAALVCARCSKPIERTFDPGWQHEFVDDGLACTTWPVRPARAPMAGEKESSSE